MFKHKRGQATVIDLLTAVFIFFIIFITIIILFDVYSTRLQKDVLREELQDKAFMLTEILLSNGIPADWNSENVQSIGLSTHDKHITEKRFDELKEISYEQAKGLFGLSGMDFYIRILEANDDFLGEYGNETETAKDIVSLRRIIFYENQAAQLEIRIWRI